MVDDSESLVSGAGSQKRSCLRTKYFWLAVLRTLQIVLGFVELCLTFFVIRVFGGDYAHTFAVSLITFSWTVILMGYIFVTPQWFPKLYHCWVHFGLEVVTVVLWLTSFSLLIWECQTWDGAENAISDTFSQDLVNAINSVPGQASAIMGLRVAAGFACVNWMLFGVSLVMTTR